MKARQKGSFAQRAHLRASVVAPESMMVPARHVQVTPKRQQPIGHHRSVTGTSFQLMSEKITRPSEQKRWDSVGSKTEQVT